MKHIILLLLMTVCTAGISAQESLIDRFGGIKGVESVYISKALLGMLPDVEAGEHNFSAIANKLDEIQIINSTDRKAAKALRSACLQFVNSGKYEKLMNVTGDGEHSGIYMKSYPNNKRQYVMLAVSDREVSVIVLTGSLTLHDIEKVIDK